MVKILKSFILTKQYLIFSDNNKKLHKTLKTKKKKILHLDPKFWDMKPKKVKRRCDKY